MLWGEKNDFTVYLLNEGLFYKRGSFNQFFSFAAFLMLLSETIWGQHSFIIIIIPY